MSADLEILRKTLPEILSSDQLVGNKIRSWWNDVTNHAPCNLPDHQLTRKALKELCRKDSGYEDIECLAAVMAWGGQNRRHAKILFQRFDDEVKPIISNMRQEKISFIEAYKDFDEVWKKPERLGMGAAYFTKLIFFCEPSHKGYIMDQWTSKSINLIAQKSIVDLQYGYVSKKNNVDNYKNFCQLMEDIARELNISGEIAERAMFSKGGWKKAAWRAHVLAKYNGNER
ncbi:MAG TPA: hypothetical protein PLF01_05135 [Alphaproteobacteria bacterium]|nr:hypothetical protein [Alphaproteobacteria bacterium]